MTKFDVRYNEIDLDYLADLMSVGARNLDSRKTAEKLLIRYGTIENLLCASSDELSASVGDNIAATLKTLAAVISRRETDKFLFGKPCTRCDVVDYFRALFVGCDVEKVYLMSFDDKGCPKRCDLVGVGTVNMSEILPRKLLEAASRAGACGVVIAHNHPGGNATASDEDIKLTAVISRVLSRAGVKLLYHCIIAGQSSNIFEINDL